MGQDRTDAQFIAQGVAMTTASLLSVVGSSLIIFMVRREASSVYNRILVLLSIGDIIFSLSNAVHLFLVPAGRTDSPIAYGNDASCNALGFVLNGASMYISAYNAFLAANFYLQIRFKWTNEEIAKKIEPAVHVVAFVLATAFPIIALLRDTYALDFSTGYCLMGSYSEECEEVVVPINDTDSAIDAAFSNTTDIATTTILECRPGRIEFDYMTNTVTVILGMLGNVGIVSTVGLYRTVYSTYSANQRYEVAAAPTSAASDDVEARNRNSDRKNHVPSQREERLKQVTWQCVMYAVIYGNTFVWAFAFGVLYWTADVSDNLGHPAIFILSFLGSFFFSAQGFFNFGVFIWPKYRRTKKVAERRLQQIVLEKESSASKPQSIPNLQTTAAAAEDVDTSIAKISPFLILYWTIKEVDSSKMSFSDRSLRSLHVRSRIDDSVAPTNLRSKNNRKSGPSVTSRLTSIEGIEGSTRAASARILQCDYNEADSMPSRPDSTRSEDEERIPRPETNEAMQASQTRRQLAPKSSASCNSKHMAVDHTGNVR